jgi:hypothetical protein
MTIGARPWSGAGIEQPGACWKRVYGFFGFYTDAL